MIKTNNFTGPHAFSFWKRDQETKWCGFHPGPGFFPFLAILDEAQEFVYPGLIDRRRFMATGVLWKPGVSGLLLQAS